MKTAQEADARTFFRDFTKQVEECAREANEQMEKKDQLEGDGFSTESLADGWINYRGSSLGFALLEDPFRITLTAGPDGPFVGFQQVFDMQTENGKAKLILEGDRNVVYDCPKELAKFALDILARKQEGKAIT